MREGEERGESIDRPRYPPSPHRSMWLLGAVALVHLGLGLALKLYFFNY